MTSTAHIDWLASEDDLKLQRTWGEWRLYSKRFLVWSPNGSPTGYEVDLWEINDHQELVDWLFHVGGKTFDPLHFFEAMQQIFREAGWRKTFNGKELAIWYWQNSEPA